MKAKTDNIPVRLTRVAEGIPLDDTVVQKKKKPVGLIIFISVWLLLAAGLFLYPTVSEFVNNLVAASHTNEYSDAVKNLTNDEYEDYLAKIREYNDTMVVGSTLVDTFSNNSDVAEESDIYEEIASVGRDGQLANIEIPSINCKLPVYKGTDDSKLEEGAQHMFRTSLPMEGDGIHVVISGHTALPTKELFNRLTELEKGDSFSVEFFGDIYNYRVSEINVVLPEDSEKLQVQPDRNLCTLVTCTPYAVNTHRLLVMGELVDVIRRSNSSREIQTVDDESDRGLVVMFVIGGILLCVTIFTVIVIVRHRRKQSAAM